MQEEKQKHHFRRWRNTKGKFHGADLSEDGKVTIDGQRLYNLSMHDNYRAHSIVIDVKGKGFQVYTFTFG